jgi:hypothetical protein
MKNINDYKKFLEKKENIREDENSHLNDDINGRWDDYNYEDDDYGHQYLNSGDSKSSFRDDEYEEDEENMDDVQHLLYLLRTMFKNNGIDVEIEHRNMDIMIYCIMEPKERLRDVMNVFSVATKLKKDILPQYDCEFEMWETRKGNPMLTFNFFYNEGLGDDNNIPF